MILLPFLLMPVIFLQHLSFYAQPKILFMKKIIIAGLLLVSCSSFAQKPDHSKAPESVRMSFSKLFPGVNDAKWEMENGNYEAEFRLDGQKTSATFDKNGTWLETERAIAIESLPGDATIYIEQHFHGKTARHAAIIKLANGDTNYEAHLNGMDYIFDADGKYIKKTKG